MSRARGRVNGNGPPRYQRDANGHELDTSALGIAIEVTQLKSSVASIQADVGQLTASMTELAKSRQFSLQNLGPLLGVGAAVTAILTLFVNNQIGPVGSNVTAIQRDIAALTAQASQQSTWQRDVDKEMQTNAAVDAASLKDREDKGARLDRLSDAVSTNSAELKAFRSDLCEVETQIEADELISVMREQYQQRLNGIFYRDGKHEELPAVGSPVPGIARTKQRC